MASWRENKIPADPLRDFAVPGLPLPLFQSSIHRLPDPITLKRKVRGGLLAFIGYMLSPLSWWNDMFVNIPLALVFAWIVSAFYRPAFGPAVVIGYWLTNVLGFVLMHKGAQTLLTNQQTKYTRRDLLKDLLISLLYTLIIIALIKYGVLKPFTNYFSNS